MTEQQAVALLQDVVQNDKRHKHYFHTVNRAKEYKAFITGEGMEKYVKQVERREDEESYNQRLSITINITETICSEVIDPQYKLPRSNSIERTLLYADNDRTKYDQLSGIIRQFWDNKFSVDRYMGKSWIELNNIDPNAFVVIDWKSNEDGSRIRPYPVEYLSEQVINYRKVNGVLEWVVVHRPEDGEDPEMFILYTKDNTVIFKRRQDFEWTYDTDIHFYQAFPITDFQAQVAVVKSRTAYYDIFVPRPHRLGFVPGFFVGFSTDLSTRDTYVSTIHKAFPVLKKIVKANSEQDVSMAFHAFPQKVQYVKPCPECGGNVRRPDGNICGHCEGTGIDHSEVHKSGQDVLLIPRPKDKEDMMELSKMIHYVGSDVRLLEYLDTVIDKWTKRCKQAVYNSEVFSRPAVAETAYSKNVDLQNVYDALWPMAEAYSTTYNFIIDAISKITQLDDKLVHNLSFRKDFKMKSLTDLYQDLAVVGTSQADEFVKRAIEDDIAEILYEDDPHELKRYKAMNHFFPFNGKGKDEIKMIVTSNTTPKAIKVLWSNFSYIFDELELEQKQKGVNLYDMNRDKQKALIDKKVEDILSKVDEETDLMIDHEPTKPDQGRTEGDTES